jgi:hypothetical protein
MVAAGACPSHIAFEMCPHTSWVSGIVREDLHYFMEHPWPGLEGPDLTSDWYTCSALCCYMRYRFEDVKPTPFYAACLLRPNTRIIIMTVERRIPVPLIADGEWWRGTSSRYFGQLGDGARCLTLDDFEFQ